ncbi:MAG TPA: aminotransferase class I/II-fold pyridoxal phosphate-dependent enzyme [Syntrophales bacterium]|nr:aminotransferase class I/II-fold pyridoxal phosphate-dependent enzyme [Syntrophales bacterium]HOM07646.1 aminotransferase class I/II-fold pyridoxal phosphate-dependent enzyme [Syntrophales bacterium]HOO00317.1 aminotransferase class I/II-fold pyridoxal phosphate-dependent enzyme [Syntrophales bacterium]HPQ07212.1 aminotransferase class I/II-fold pyridoxal phosphate-dependent enzyme [Syntrophales bacterium]
MDMTDLEKRETFLPFNRPTIADEDVEAVASCLRSGWITTGPRCGEFEDLFRRLTGASGAVSVSSATAGMHLLLTALGIGPGDEVITPSLTFASTVNQIVLRGARPVFVDVEYGTLNLDPARLEEAVTPRTKAVIPVHFAGAPADMDGILKIAERHGLFVIEDAAHALGTTYRGVHAGGFGVPAVFSFHPIKNITTGEGGMITVDDAALEAKLRLLRFHGIARDAWRRYGKGGDPSYDVFDPGYKYNLTDLQAALGISQLRRLGDFNRRRASLATRYLEGLAGVAGLDLPAVPPYPHEHSWHLFVVKVTGMERERFWAGLADWNIGYGLHFPAAHLLDYVRGRLGPQATLPETERAARGIVSLPLYPAMTEGDVDYVCRAVRRILAAGEGP